MGFEQLHAIPQRKCHGCVALLPSPAPTLTPVVLKIGKFQFQVLSAGSDLQGISRYQHHNPDHEFLPCRRPGAGNTDDLVALTPGQFRQVAQGEHQQAIDAWTAAAALRPDSNVPHNNIANAYLSLDRVDSALTVAQQAFGLKADYMTSVTLSNVHKRRKDFREAERVLLQGVAATEKSDEPHEHPFWSLASLYWDQGDYREYLRLAHLGIKHKSPSSCQPDARPTCALPAFEVDIIDKLCNASLDVGRYTCAGGDAAGGDAAQAIGASAGAATGYVVGTSGELPRGSCSPPAPQSCT